jgi:hypothetical protein
LKTKICRQTPKIKKNGKIRGRLAGFKVLKKSNVKIFLLTKRAILYVFQQVGGIVGKIAQYFRTYKHKSRNTSR